MRAVSSWSVALAAGRWRGPPAFALFVALVAGCGEPDRTALLEDERQACVAFIARLNQLECSPTQQDFAQCNVVPPGRSDDEIVARTAQLSCAAEHMHCDAQGFQTTGENCSSVANAGTGAADGETVARVPL